LRHDVGDARRSALIDHVHDLPLTAGQCVVRAAALC
jgi:hypothetical protein